METAQKSKGHLLFAGPFEYFEIGGEVYRAPITDNVLDTQGYRRISKRLRHAARITKRLHTKISKNRNQ